MSRLVLFLVGALGACHGSPRTAITKRMTAAQPTAESCAGCHAVQYTEWSRSWHRRAWTDADFQASYRVDHHQYCVDCHAPQLAARGLAGANEGVGCVDCHSIPNGHGHAPTARVTTHACRACHDFPAPGTQSPLQTTWTEHAASPFADTSCVSCHAPSTDGRHDHTMVGAHDRGLVTRALTWTTRALPADRVEVRVLPVGVGHRIPTGDVFRRLQLTAVVEDVTGRMIGYEERSFRRDWDEHANSLRQRRPERFDGDTRLDAAGTTLEIACSGPPARVHLVLTYDRGAFGRGDELESFESFDVVDEVRELSAHGRKEGPIR